MPLTDDPWLETDSDGNVPAVRAGAPVAVYRFDGDSSLTALPNLECLGIAIKEGTDTGSARFRYNLASGLDGAPISIETALGTQFTGPYVVNSGDRLVVQAQRPDGSVENLFDGLAVVFGLGLDPDFEEVQIGAIGIAWHCWDDVIPGAIIRDATPPGQVLKDTPTAVPAQFNPKGLPNCTPDGYMAGTASNGADYRYPTFIDPNVKRQPTDLRTYWTLPKAARYILFNANKSQQYVNNPDGAALDSLLVAPTDGSAINCPDTPITGKDWPGTVNRLVAECGFGTCFRLSTDGGGLPRTDFVMFKQQGGTVKSLYLAPRGTPFDPTLFNFNESGLHRDLSEVVNKVTVVGALDRYEASFVLEPGFPMKAADASAANLKDFETDSPLYLTKNKNAYRLYVFDECGEGHYQPGTNTAITTAASLDDVFGAPVNGVARYARRRRVPIGTMISVDPTTNIPYDARLSISTDYDPGNTKTPGVWDGTGTWQVVTSSTWKSCDDRLGIVITDSNPNKWDVGQPKNGTGLPFPSGVVNAVEKQATAAAGQNFWLRLTCVVEADSSLTQVAAPTGGSPLPQAINRVVDASDRYRRDYIDHSSEFAAAMAQNASTPSPRNDNAAALAEAQALQYGQQSGVLEGPVTIPRLTTYYQVGDRIDQVEGRNLGLRTDQGTGSPVYPVVVGVSWGFSPYQSTTLELSDAGTDRARYQRKPGRQAQGRREGPTRAMREAQARGQARARSGLDSAAVPSDKG